jgi:hypothetical protein
VTQYVPVNVELERVSPTKLKLGLVAALLVVAALDIVELVASLS